MLIQVGNVIVTGIVGPKSLHSVVNAKLGFITGSV
jgi:hypothetical protein